MSASVVFIGQDMDVTKFSAPLIVINDSFDFCAESQFLRVFKTLENLVEATYLFYMFENKDISKRITFSTNQDWQAIYVNDNLLVNCPLLFVGRHQMNTSKSKSTILRWNDVNPENRLQRNVMGARSEFNIANGISFAKEFYNIREMIGIGADIKNTGFTRDLILNMPTITELLFQLRKIAMQEIAQKSWAPILKTTLH